MIRDFARLFKTMQHIANLPQGGRAREVAIRALKKMKRHGHVLKHVKRTVKVRKA